MTARPTTGRPLQFLLSILLFWACARLAFVTYWATPVSAEDTAVAPGQAVAARQVAVIRPSHLPDIFPASKTTFTPHLRPADAIFRPVGHADQRTNAPLLAPAGAAPPSVVDTLSGGEKLFANVDIGPLYPFAVPPPAKLAALSDHWRGGAWLLWRAGSGGTALAGNGQLGGSQAGLRVERILTDTASGRLAAYTRITAALDRPHAPEAAAGIAWQPGPSIPISLAVERRIGLGDGARDAFALMAVGGFGPVDLPAGIRAQGYGQAGMVGLKQRDAFVDGRLSLLHPLGRTPLSAGFSLSGGAQPHVSRLDIGPAVEVRLPLAHSPARLVAEWRQRIGGNARPGSGAALTLATDF